MLVPISKYNFFRHYECTIYRWDKDVSKFPCLWLQKGHIFPELQRIARRFILNQREIRNTFYEHIRSPIMK